MTSIGRQPSKYPAVSPSREFGFFGAAKRVDEGIVLVFVHRAIEVGGALFLGFAFVIARLHPRFAHVDAVMVDDRGDGIKECEGLCACFGRDGRAQIGGGQRAGGNDPMAAVWQGSDLTVFNADVGMRHQGVGYGLCKWVTINSKRATCGQAVFFGGLHDQSVRLRAFPNAADPRRFVRCHRSGRNWSKPFRPEGQSGVRRFPPWGAFRG